MMRSNEQDDGLALTVPRINSRQGSFGKPEYASDLAYMADCTVFCGDDRLKEISSHLMKIDVEGFELDVLNGLTETGARSSPPMIVEMSTQPLSNAGASFNQVYDFITDHRCEQIEHCVRSPTVRLTLGP